MALVLGILSLLLVLGSLVCWVLILIHAFQKSVGKGFLCLCVPCFILYYMFAEFEHPKKALIIAGYLGGGILGGLASLPAQMERMEAMREMQNMQMQESPGTGN